MQNSLKSVSSTVRTSRAVLQHVSLSISRHHDVSNIHCTTSTTVERECCQCVCLLYAALLLAATDSNYKTIVPTHLWRGLRMPSVSLDKPSHVHPDFCTTTTVCTTVCTINIVVCNSVYLSDRLSRLVTRERQLLQDEIMCAAVVNVRNKMCGLGLHSRTAVLPTKASATSDR